VAKFFVRSLRTYFNLEDENIKITCNLFAAPRAPGVVQSIFGSIQEYAGFGREAWLE
jgi:hypothetical protein